MTGRTASQRFTLGYVRGVPTARPSAEKVDNREEKGQRKPAEGRLASSKGSGPVLTTGTLPTEVGSKAGRLKPTLGTSDALEAVGHAVR